MPNNKIHFRFSENNNTHRTIGGTPLFLWIFIHWRKSVTHHFITRMMIGIAHWKTIRSKAFCCNFQQMRFSVIQPYRSARKVKSRKDVARTCQIKSDFMKTIKNVNNLWKMKNTALQYSDVARIATEIKNSYREDKPQFAIGYVKLHPSY